MGGVVVVLTLLTGCGEAATTPEGSGPGSQPAAAVPTANVEAVGEAATPAEPSPTAEPEAPTADERVEPENARLDDLAATRDIACACATETCALEAMAAFNARWEGVEYGSAAEAAEVLRVTLEIADCAKGLP